jgi:hypothetical protein
MCSDGVWLTTHSNVASHNDCHLLSVGCVEAMPRHVMGTLHCCLSHCSLGASCLVIAAQHGALVAAQGDGLLGALWTLLCTSLRTFSTPHVGDTVTGCIVEDDLAEILFQC